MVDLNRGCDRMYLQGGGTGFHVLDAANSVVADSPQFPIQPPGWHRFRQRASADDWLRPAPGAVQRSSDESSSQEGRLAGITNLWLRRRDSWSGFSGYTHWREAFDW